MNRWTGPALAILASIVVLSIAAAWLVYTQFRIDVPAKHIAIITQKTGLDMENHQEIAPSSDHKGIQREILTEGRYFYNPYSYDWKVEPMIEVATDQLGVRVRLEGDDLEYGEIIAWEETQKGIVPEVLRPGRYAINPYLEKVELHQPVTIPAGFKGVVTLLAAPIPQEPNKLLVKKGERGVQEETLDPGTYYINPYVKRINVVDCRSQRFNLGEDMGFPSKDGFWIILEGIIEFRVKPTEAAPVYVTYNDIVNDSDGGGGRIDEEIIKKIIMPNARSFCRLRGSDHSGREFISGDTRIEFQAEFQKAMQEFCDPLGVEIIQALITKIRPPQAIAGPVRDREVARQKLAQYTQQILQQESEKSLAIEQAMIAQRQALVDADRKVVEITTQAKRLQDVTVTKANENLKVAERRLNAAKDEALAIFSRGKAEADVIDFNNEALAAGWKRAVNAFAGDGKAYAKYVLYQKLAPGFQSIMANTADSPLMEIFKNFETKKTEAAKGN
jgi:hypothetical protein